MMNAKELMNPRFEVIADYPSNPNAVGTILECPYSGSSDMLIIQSKYWTAYHERYPHIFKILNWWDYRTVEQMPKKLICKAFGSNNGIIPIEEWDMDTLWGWRNKNDRIGCGLRDFPEFSYFPVD